MIFELIECRTRIR